MEQKKSPEANLERYRLTWFLLGMVMVLSTTYVSLKISSDKQMLQALIDEEMEDVDVDLDDLVLEKEEERIAVQLHTKEQPTEMNIVEQITPEATPLDLYTPPTELAEMKPDENVEEVMKALNEEQDEEKLVIAEELPEFPGGLAEFARWVTKKMRYPNSARDAKKKGRVIAQFIVETDGSISDLKLVKKFDTACDREVLRVLRGMPNWKPATHNGKPIPCMMCVPIEFAI